MEAKLYRVVLWLAIFTIGYNAIEGLVSVWLGAEDETLTLFGFGFDSFIEVISGIGILQMVLRITHNPHDEKGRAEILALRITGWSFIVLAAGLVIGAGYNFYVGHKPLTTFWGIVISVISILIMTALYKLKINYGTKLGSDPVIADGRCTLVCIYMSIILLASSAIYELTGFGWVDTLGSLGLAWFSFSEGREALEKVKSDA